MSDKFLYLSELHFPPSQKEDDHSHPTRWQWPMKGANANKCLVQGLALGNKPYMIAAVILQGQCRVFGFCFSLRPPWSAFLKADPAVSWGTFLTRPRGTGPARGPCTCTQLHSTEGSPAFQMSLKTLGWCRGSIQCIILFTGQKYITYLGPLHSPFRGCCFNTRLGRGDHCFKYFYSHQVWENAFKAVRCSWKVEWEVKPTMRKWNRTEKISPNLNHLKQTNVWHSNKGFL